MAAEVAGIFEALLIVCGGGGGGGDWRWVTCFSVLIR